MHLVADQPEVVDDVGRPAAEVEPDMHCHAPASCELLLTVTVVVDVEPRILDRPEPVEIGYRTRQSVAEQPQCRCSTA